MGTSVLINADWYYLAEAGHKWPYRYNFTKM